MSTATQTPRTPDFYRNKIKAAEEWLADEKDSMRDLERRHAHEREQQRRRIEIARTQLGRNHELYASVAPEPWCNHDAVAASRGICECGVRVS